MEIGAPIDGMVTTSDAVQRQPFMDFLAQLVLNLARKSVSSFLAASAAIFRLRRISWAVLRC